MSQKEILDEFWKDYRNSISPSILKFAERKRHDIVKILKRTKGDWVPTKRIYNVRGNRYHVCSNINARCYGTPKCINTTFLIVIDSMSGKKRVYLFPSSDNPESLVVFTAHAIKRLGEVSDVRGESFEELVENLMSGSLRFKVRSDVPEENQLEVHLGEERIGIGHKNSEAGYYEVQTVTTKSTLDQYRIELGLSEETGYYEIWKTYKDRDTVQIQEVLSPQTKEDEIKAAWEMYEKEMRGTI